MFQGAKLGVLLGALALLAGPAAGQDYPSRPVKVIVPFAPGGPADVNARLIGQLLSEQLKQSFVIENRPGAGSILGTQEAARGVPDGHTLLMMSNTHTTNETLIADKPYQLMRDFLPIAPVNYSDLVLVVHPSVGVNTLAELITLAKSKPKGLNYASSGLGTPYHMAGELFNAMAGIEIVHVPYRGSSQARTDIIGGHIQMMIDAITTMAPNVQAGQVRALGTTGQQRSTVLPAVPTVSEAGVPGYEATIWLGLMAPAGTPRPLIDRLNGEVNRILSRAEVKDSWGKQGAVPMIMTVAEFDAFLRKDIEKWAQVIKVSGAKAE